MAPLKRERTGDSDDEDWIPQSTKTRRLAMRAQPSRADESEDEDRVPQSSNTRRPALRTRPARQLPSKKSTISSRLDKIEEGGLLEMAASTGRIVAKDVLSHTKISIKSRQIYARNETASRLLKLPAEVRNRIWELVIGSNTVHVWSQGSEVNTLSSRRKLCRSVCQREDCEKEEAQNIKTSHETDKQLGYHERHNSCKHANQQRGLNAKDQLTPTSMHLALLAVCRQIHNEASLLPYHNNTFSFEWIIDLEAFISHLVPTQVQAVQNITFVMHHFESSENFEKMLQKKLSGLKSLVMFVQFVGGEDYAPDVGVVGKSGGMYEKESNYQERVMTDVLRLQRLPAEDVTVATYNSPGLFIYRGQNFERPIGSTKYALLKEFERKAEKGLAKKW